MATKHYDAVGVDHTLQQDITKLMHELVKTAGKFTLAEIGYLHMSTLAFNLQTQCIQLKIFFDVRLAARKCRDVIVDGYNIAPVDELNIFNGYFFVGSLQDVVTFEKIMCPKVEIVEDNFGRAALHFKEKGHEVKKLDALVLNCSYPLTMAAVNNISLMDPAYKPTAHIIAAAAEDALDSIVTHVKQTTVPLSVDIEYTAGFGGYDHDDAITYLQRISGTTDAASRNQDKIVREVERRTKKNKKKNTSKSDKWLNKYT
ncbi:MAG: hypothetical protein NC489_08325 [Ruminococcus flavefaciens]|nr:hypothetical protein [Ruminococcus flavefaciens]